ncbi:hypothetical protein CJ030_MR1G014048 [Morella rubra]|uniref:Uncharacterized protein n=1 Tax=Morella rubra TaxID=262757 RepID=A0A6A1WPG1_9ROSI|nr:hypothetical protein CJ030_MR1G014048 [Morella rubra]
MCAAIPPTLSSLASVSTHLAQQLQQVRSEIEEMQIDMEKDYEELVAKQSEIENILQEQQEHQEIQERQ